MGTPIEDARTALDNFDAHGVIFGPDVATAIRALIAEHERLIAMQSGEEHGEAIYSPEVFESMNGYLASANGSPMLALRLAVSERLTALPTDDEREALAAQLFKRATGRTDFADLVGEGGEYVRNSYRASADILLEDLDAAGFRRQGPITDAQEQAAFESWNGMHVGTVRDRLRAALEAARDAS